MRPRDEKNELKSLDRSELREVIGGGTVRRRVIYTRKRRNWEPVSGGPHVTRRRGSS